jgi:EAL domain-containing protein (putative c-di-GMP-specific phosphodiesterase class I)/GGDEF domain-containing protein
VLAIVILIHFYHKKKIHVPQTNVFVWLVWISLVTDLMDAFTVLIDERRYSVALVDTVNVVYLVLFNALPFLYYRYLFVSVKKKADWNRWDRLVLYAPIGVTVLLIVTSPITKLIFSYDLDIGYHHGTKFALLYVATTIYIVGTMVVAMCYRKLMTAWQLISVYFYLLSSVLGIVIQTVFPNVLVMQYAVSVSLLFLYMSLENSSDYEDKQLSVYNRRGFEKSVAIAVDRRDEFYIFIVDITNYQSIREAIGVDFSQSLLKTIVADIKNRIKPLKLFYLEGGRMAVIVGGREHPKRVAETVRAELGKSFSLGEMNIQLESLLLQMDYPQDVKSVEDVMDAIDYYSTVPFESSDGEILHFSEEILHGKRRETQILQCMQKALINGTFQVYYQPIYSASRHRYNSAEALIRLYDENMGYLNPEEFIPMAEKNGMILKIGEFVFRTVCQMMARERIWEKGIDYIEVNLSVVQCMQEDICEMLYGIMDEYEVPYSCINLEITETVLSKDILWDTMERMVVGGVTFSLDDYGTGYSNLTNILKYPFHIVKLDKSMVWSAMEDERAMLALKHTVAMVLDLDMYIVAEGVETEEMVKTLTELGCEYLQGYYFSRPVCEADFLEKLYGEK